MYIPYGRQAIDESDIQAVVEALRSDFLTTGPKIYEFEQIVANYVGAKYAVAISNGTAALHAACHAAGITKGDEVITSPITFAASTNAVLYCGGTPVFADIDPVSYNIDPFEIRKKISNRTKAIIAVHYTGQPCNMDLIHQIANENNLVVIEDAAHALGADCKGIKVGNISDMTTFSFHPVKHITTAEGGMITTNDKELYDKLKLFRAHGITRELDSMTKNDGDWYYEQVNLGYNYRITDIQCALGISQMSRINQFIARRIEIANKYNDAFKSIENIIIPHQIDGCTSSWHLYVIQILNKNRKDVFDGLRNAGIGVNVHYIPVYSFPYYRQNGYENTVCRNAEEFYNRIISLPIYSDLSDSQQQYVIDKVIELVK